MLEPESNPQLPTHPHPPPLRPTSWTITETDLSLFSSWTSSAGSRPKWNVLTLTVIDIYSDRDCLRDGAQRKVICGAATSIYILRRILLKNNVKANKSHPS